MPTNLHKFRQKRHLMGIVQPDVSVNLEQITIRIKFNLYFTLRSHQIQASGVQLFNFTPPSTNSLQYEIDADLDLNVG
jgi:hypothetical protein